MGLLEQIKENHSRRNAKRPYRRTGYSIVSAIVSRYGLQEDFIRKLHHQPDTPNGDGLIDGPLKRKKVLEAPPFSVSDRKQYLVTKKILEAADNPYLAFACSPDEIILSRRLFERNPSIRPELLEARDFETLLLVEQARSRLDELSSAAGELSGDDAAGTGNSAADKAAKPAGEADYKSGIDALRERIRALREFISLVENPNWNEGEKWPEN